MKVAYERAGAGPAIVFLHGAFSDRHEWRAQMDDLQRDHTVVAWDTPGWGETEALPDADLPGCADLLATFIEAQALERPCVCGLSFGGGLALELHRRHPHHVGSLILVSAYAGWGGSLPPEEAQRRVEASGGHPLAHSFAATDLREHLPTVDVPTLVVHGTRDTRAPRPVAEALHRGIPGSRLAVVEAGHEVNTEAPEALTREIRAFLRLAALA